MSRLIGATLILASSAALAGPHLTGGGGLRAGGMSHAPTHAAAAIPAQQSQYAPYARENRVAHRDPTVNRMCTAQQRNGNKCLDRGWNVTAPPGAPAQHRNAP